MTLNEFIEGILFWCKERGATALYMKGTILDQAFEKLYEELDLDEFNFRIACHPIYGDSTKLRRSLDDLLHRGALYYRLPYDGYIYLERLMNPEDDRFNNWAHRLMDIYLHESV